MAVIKYSVAPKLLLEDVSLQSCDLNFKFTIKFVKIVRLLEALRDICRDACREPNGRENMKHAFLFLFGSLIVSRRPLNVQCQMLHNEWAHKCKEMCKWTGECRCGIRRCNHICWTCGHNMWWSFLGLHRVHCSKCIQGLLCAALRNCLLFHDFPSAIIIVSLKMVLWDQSGLWLDHKIFARKWELDVA